MRGARVGGEFVLKHAGDLDFVQREWFTPAADLAAIYATTGRTTVTPDDISNCMRLGFLGIWANRVRGPLTCSSCVPRMPLTAHTFSAWVPGL